MSNSWSEREEGMSKCWSDREGWMLRRASGGVQKDQVCILLVGCRRIKSIDHPNIACQSMRERVSGPYIAVEGQRSHGGYKLMEGADGGGW